ncbi:MAG: helix-turn-helix domain-containing protein [Candidatus Merdivicinus sp.]
MDIDYKEIGKRIRQKRLDLKISQEKLADLVDLSKPHMSHIENGTTKVSLPTLIAIANALQCTLDVLVTDSLECAEPLYQYNIFLELQDCTPDELKIIEDLIHAVKTSLRRNRRNTE